MSRITIALQHCYVKVSTPIHQWKMRVLRNKRQFLKNGTLCQYFINKVSSFGNWILQSLNARGKKFNHKLPVLFPLRDDHIIRSKAGVSFNSRPNRQIREQRILNLIVHAVVGREQSLPCLLIINESLQERISIWSEKTPCLRRNPTKKLNCCFFWIRSA